MFHFQRMTHSTVHKENITGNKKYMESIYYVLTLPASGPPRGPTKAKGLIYLSHKWDIFRRGAQEMSGSKDGGAGCDPDGWTAEDSGEIRKAHLLTPPPPCQ